MIDDAAAYPGNVPALTSEQVPAVRRAAEIIQQSLRPASADQVRATVAKLSIAFPRQRSSDAEADVRLEQYVEGLDDIPADVLEQAYRQTIKTRKFFPTVAELRELCTGLAFRKWRLSRIALMLRTYDRLGPARHDTLLPSATPEPAQPTDRGKTRTMGQAARHVLNASRNGGDDP